MPLHVPASAGQSHWSGYVEPEPGLALPCTIIRGRKKGPKLLVTAGVHGAEYSSIEAARRLTALDPDRLSGELTILPILNIKAFWSHQPYINPLDGKNINRVFPGNAEGTASDRLAAWLVQTGMQGMDAYVDLHCGDIIEALLPFAIYLDGDSRSAEVATACGFSYVVRSGASSGHSYGAASKLGIPGVLLESGGNGLWSEDSVGLLETGVALIMAKLGMLSDVSATGVTPRVCQMAVTKAPVSGYWHPAVTPGATVERGASVGVIHDLVGPGKRTILAEHSGPILYHVTSLAISEGEPLVGIAI